LIVKNGDIIHVSQDEFKIVGTAPAGAVYVDGLGVGDVSDEILEDRQAMAGDGVLVIGCVMHPKPHAKIASRGFINNGTELMEAIEEQVDVVLERGAKEKKPLENVRDDVYYVVRRFVRKATGRNPVIIPVVVE
jgi:ribonuclease J